MDGMYADFAGAQTGHLIQGLEQAPYQTALEIARDSSEHELIIIEGA